MTQVNNLKIENTKITNNDFLNYIKNSSREIVFKSCQFEEPIEIISRQRLAIGTQLTFVDCTFKKIDFEYIAFTGKIRFQSCTIEQEFQIHKCTFHERFMADGISANKISMVDVEFFSQFDLYEFNTIDELLLVFTKINTHITISQNHTAPIKAKRILIIFEEMIESLIYLENLTAQKVNLKFPLKPLTHPLMVTGIEADELTVTGLKSKAKIEFRKIFVNRSQFSHLHNDGGMSWEQFGCNNRHRSVFDLTECYMGKAELYHVDLIDFEKVQLINCHLQDIIPVDVKWNFRREAYSEIRQDHAREVFRQLKNVCAKNMDKVSQLRFEKLEMYYYSKQLSWKNNFQDWLIMKTNEWSNDHGQSWIRPLAWLLATSFIFFTAIQISNGNWDCYHIGSYLNFLMPFHRIEDVVCFAAQKHQKNWIWFWDILQKLSSSYFIFQYLRAFRKYVG